MAARQFQSPEDRAALLAEFQGEDTGEDQTADLDLTSQEDDDENQAEPEKPEKPRKAPSKPQVSVKDSVGSLKQEHRQEYDPASKIPPQRWNQVLDERNSLRAKLKDLEAKQQRQPLQTPAQEKLSIDQEIDRLLGNDPVDVPQDKTAQKLAELERRQALLDSRENARAVQEEVQKLNREVAEVQKAYPFVNRELLLRAIHTSEDPDKVDLMEVAERWEGLMESEFAQRAKARGLSQTAANKEAKQQMQQREAPRPRSSGSSQDRDFTKETVNLANPKDRLAYARQLARGG